MYRHRERSLGKVSGRAETNIKVKADRREKEQKYMGDDIWEMINKPFSSGNGLSCRSNKKLQISTLGISIAG